MSTMHFALPASDADLVDQVFEFVEEYDVDHGEMLLGMARKYRFAGYIGTISYLFTKVMRCNAKSTNYAPKSPSGGRGNVSKKFSRCVPSTRKMERPSRRVIGLPVAKELPPRVSALLAPSKCMTFTHTYAPIENIDGYIRDRGLTGAEEELYRRLYTPKPEPEPEKREVPNVPFDPLHVFVVFNLKNPSRIKVKITVPWEPVYLAQKKGTLPPLDVRVKAAQGFGYPESTLLQMVKYHSLRKERVKKMDECIEAVFGKCMNSKVNKPKKKTVQEALNSKFKKKPARKFS